MSNHYRKTIKLYKSRKNTGQECAFCSPSTIGKAIYSDDLVFVVPNLTKYDLWEFHDVTDHLLLIPRKHVKSLSELNTKEKQAIINVIADYEDKGYNIYARGKGFSKRSIEHQHTHLIKVTNTNPKIALFIRKPYLLFKR